MKETPFLTIIMPVYNTPEKYILRMAKCLERQKNNNFEIIIVDDGSDKVTRNLLDELRIGGNVVKVIHKNNEGVSAARNTGIKIVKTEYIAFVDADDILSDRFVEQSFKYAQMYNPDVVYGAMDYIPYRKYIQHHGCVDVFTGENVEEAIKALLLVKPRKLQYQILGTPCGRIYRTSIVKNTGFRENIHYYEDQIFNREFLRKSYKVVVVPETWYYYLQNSFSAMHKERNKNFYKKTRSYWDIYHEMNQQEDESYKNSLRLKGLEFYYAVINNDYVGHKMEFNEKVRELREISRHPMIKDAIDNLNIGWKEMNFLQRFNLFLLKTGAVGFLYIEKEIIHKLHLNKKLQ